MKSNKEDETSKTQADKFRDLARQLECDDDEEAFDEGVDADPGQAESHGG